MKSTESIWQFLGDIPIGTVISWCIVIFAIIGAICALAIKLYKVFDKYQKIRDENEHLKATVEEHDNQLVSIRKEMKEMKEDIVNELKKIRQSQEESRETKIKELRHSIITSGEKAIADKNMTIRQWKSLHDMANEYIHKYNQNSYAKSLVEKVDRDVEVIGQLDEHGYDIE